MAPQVMTGCARRRCGGGPLRGTVELTNLSAYSAPSPLSKLLILHPSVDRFRLQNSRFLLNLTIPTQGVHCYCGKPVNQAEDRLPKALSWRVFYPFALNECINLATRFSVGVRKEKKHFPRPAHLDTRKSLPRETTDTKGRLSVALSFNIGGRPLNSHQIRV